MNKSLKKIKAKTSPGKRFKIVEDMLGLQQETLCALLKVSHPTLRKYRINPNFKKETREVLQEIGINSDWIEFRKDSVFLPGFDIETVREIANRLNEKALMV